MITLQTTLNMKVAAGNAFLTLHIAYTGSL